MSRPRKEYGLDSESGEFATDYTILPNPLNITGCRMIACAVVSDVVKEWRAARANGNEYAMKNCEDFLKGYAYRFYYCFVPDRLPENIMKYLEENPDPPPRAVFGESEFYTDY